VVRNVPTVVEPPRQQRPQTPEPLDVAECKRVLAAAEGRRNAARWTDALALGLRQSEALALQWRDIDLDARRLSVRRGLHRVPGEGLVFTEPKTDRSRRTIALPGPLIEALREHRVRQDEEREVAGTEWQEGDLVFAQPNGRPLDKHSDYEAWCALLQDAGVRHIRLHDQSAHRGHAVVERRRPPAGRDGAARTQPDAHHDRHLQPRHARTRPGGSRPHERHPLGLTTRIFEPICGSR
jgi:integrase